MAFALGIFHQKDFAGLEYPLFPQRRFYFYFPVQQNDILLLRRIMKIVIVGR